jgi:hypothetical protein
MNVDFKENADGSGVITIDELSEDEAAKFIRYGIIYALKKALEEDLYNPENFNEALEEESNEG